MSTVTETFTNSVGDLIGYNAAKNAFFENNPVHLYTPLMEKGISKERIDTLLAKANYAFEMGNQKDTAALQMNLIDLAAAAGKTPEEIDHLLLNMITTPMDGINYGNVGVLPEYASAIKRTEDPVLGRTM